MRKLFLRLNGAHPIDEVITDLLDTKVKSKLIKKGDYLAREGHIFRYLYYIERGIVSHYITKEEGNKTSWILKENDVVTSVDSFFLQTPSEENIITHEDTLVWYISFSDWDETFKKSEAFKTITDRIKTEYYSKQSKHQRLIQLLSHEEIIKQVLANDPELLNRVDRDTLASWLGMSTKTFNKYL